MSKINTEPKLTDFIVKLDGLFPELLREKINSLIDVENLKDMRVGGHVLNDDIRKVKGFVVSSRVELKKENVSRYIFYKHICTFLQNFCFNNYCIMTKQRMFDDLLINQIDFLKYEKNGKYEIHIDGGPESNRQLTTIINLNDDYEGGEFEFYSPNRQEVIAQYKLKKGSVLMFPSNFMYPHSVKTITSGTRKSLVCWAQ